MSKRNNRLRSLFCKKLEEWAKKKKEEHLYLTMKLVTWANKPISIEDREFWYMVEGQIQFRAKKMGISPKKVIKCFFNQENSEEWMSKFE